MNKSVRSTRSPWLANLDGSTEASKRLGGNALVSTDFVFGDQQHYANAWTNKTPEDQRWPDEESHEEPDGATVKS